MQTAQQQLIRLNLGAGESPLPGYANLDRKSGQEVYPLPFADGVAAEIRAAHVLEHFGFFEVPAVLREWVRVLAVGGWLRIAVPDLDWIVMRLASAHLPTVPDGTDPALLVAIHTDDSYGVQPIENYLFGGQRDADDFHKMAFNEWKLTALMRAVGLTSIRRWKSEIADCASLPVSLNLEGRKV